MVKNPGSISLFHVKHSFLCLNWEDTVMKKPDKLLVTKIRASRFKELKIRQSFVTRVRNERI